MKIVFVFLAALVLLLGCASTGSNFELADARALEPGVTTLAQATEKLGKPVGTNYTEEGKVVKWGYASASPYHKTKRVVEILFDPSDVMVRLVSESEQGAGLSSVK